MKVYLNGTFLPENQALVPATDRGFLFGEGVFTTLRVENGLPQCWPLHLQRLEEHCKVLGLAMPEISSMMIRELIACNEAFHGIWRMKIVITSALLLMTLNQYDDQSSVFRLVNYPIPISRPCSHLKTLSYLDSLQVVNYAAKRGADDAIVHDGNGCVLETSFANIFWRQGNRLIIPSSSLSYLRGIALKMVHECGQALKMDMCETKSKAADLPQADQVFICNSLRGIVPVISIDDSAFQRDLLWEKAFKETFSHLISKNTPDL